MNTKKILIFLISHLISTFAISATEKTEVLSDWFALGSGCRAKHDLAGDVSVQKNVSPQTAETLINMQSFLLTTEKPSKKSPLRFAKECAFRMSINTPKNKRIKRVYTRSTANMTKAASSELIVKSVLSLGSVHLGESRHDYGSTDVLDQKEVSLGLDTLEAGAEVKDFLGAVKCGESKIVGLDFTFLSLRDSSREFSSAALANGGKVAVVAEFEDCAAEQALSKVSQPLPVKKP